MLLISSASTFAHDGVFPLGDGKISGVPKRDYVFACQKTFRGGGGAHRVGEWIGNKTWTKQGKPTVAGKVTWPDARIDIMREGDRRVVMSNGLPTHITGTFPIDPRSASYAYDRNPNRITTQRVLLRLPAEPKLAETPACIPMGTIGFAISGVAIFNAFDLSGRDAPAYEIQDNCGGHPERNGRYHYHDWSPCLETGNRDAPVGWMLDGYPILGPIDSSGTVFTNADLDECHGTTGRILVDGHYVNAYHYKFTYEFPYTIGCFRGVPTTLER